MFKLNSCIVLKCFVVVFVVVVFLSSISLNLVQMHSTSEQLLIMKTQFEHVGSGGNSKVSSALRMLNPFLSPSIEHNSSSSKRMTSSSQRFHTTIKNELAKYTVAAVISM